MIPFKYITSSFKREVCMWLVLEEMILSSQLTEAFSALVQLSEWFHAASDWEPLPLQGLGQSLGLHPTPSFQKNDVRAYVPPWENVYHPDGYHLSDNRFSFPVHSVRNIISLFPPGILFLDTLGSSTHPITEISVIPMVWVLSSLHLSSRYLSIGGEAGGVVKVKLEYLCSRNCDSCSSSGLHNLCPTHYPRISIKHIHGSSDGSASVHVPVHFPVVVLVISWSLSQSSHHGPQSISIMRSRWGWKPVLSVIWI